MGEREPRSMSAAVSTPASVDSRAKKNTEEISARTILKTLVCCSKACMIALSISGGNPSTFFRMDSTMD